MNKSGYFSIIIKLRHLLPQQKTILVLQGTICFCTFIYLKALPLGWNIQGFQPVDSALMKALRIKMNVRKQINLQRTKSEMQVRHEVAIYSSPMATPWGKICPTAVPWE